MALIPWWISYPNVNDEIMNLDWLLKVSNENTEKISNFINLNTIKYADPILWNITSQYEANTIVVDPQSGDAYISTEAVPYGVHLSNTNYWTKIYNYADAINGLEEQIAPANERLSTTASAPRSVGELVWLDGQLYVVTAPMIAGDSYVIDSNIKKTTIEKIFGNLDNLDTEAKTSIVNAINEIVGNIGDLDSLDTEAKTSIVNAINEIVENIGDLDSLDTEAKTSIVNAINEVVNNINNIVSYPFVNVLKPLHGLTPLDNTGNSDNTARLQAIIDYLSTNSIRARIVFPTGVYLINGNIEVKQGHTLFEGEEKGAVELTTTNSSNTMFTIKANFITFRDLAFWVRNGDSTFSNTFINHTNGNNKLQIENCMFYDAKLPIIIENGGGIRLRDVTIAPNTIIYDGFIGIHLKGVNASTYILNSAINAYGHTNATCLKIEGRPSDLFIDGLETARGTYAIDMSCDNETNPTDIKFTNLVLDEPINRGIYLHDLKGSDNRFSMSLSDVNIMPHTVNSVGIYVSNCRNISLNNLNVHNNHQANTMSAMSIINSINIAVNGGQFVDITRLALVSSGTRSISLRNLNSFNVNKAGNGIQLQTSRGCLITGCMFYGNFSNAIEVTTGCVNNVVTNNVITTDESVSIVDNGTGTIKANNMEQVIP